MNDESIEIEKNLEKARRLYVDHSRVMSMDKTFSSLLSAYGHEIENSRVLMTALGLPELCSYCATEIPGGGCCGSHIATWYDPIVLLLNLLMDVEIQDKSYYKNCCRFLGRDGCTLKARYHFCVNYLCPRIYKALDEEAVSRLKAQSGAELFLGWKLECYLLDRFSKMGLSF